MPRTLRPLLGLMALLLLAPGCDSDGAGGFDDLLADARIARQSGQLDAAVRLYEQALALDPDSAPVRVELAATVLARAEVNLLDLDRIALFLTETTGGAVDAPIGASAGIQPLTCPDAADPTAQPFDPTDVEGYAELEAQRAAVDEVLAILQGAGPVEGGDAVIPPGLRLADGCGGVENGQLVYDRAAALAYLRAAGLSDADIATALAVHATARLVDAYLFVATDLPQQTAWYRLADGGVGVCAADPIALRAQATVAVADFGEALTALDLRAEVLGAGADDPARTLVQTVLDAYEAIREDLGPYCGAS